MNTTNDNDARKKVWELIKDIRFALLITHDAENRMHARPMSAITKEFNDELWFLTSVRSPKLEEIARNPDVLVSYAEPKSQTYVSIRGRAEQVQDRGKITELWSEPARVWFPKGAEDPDIALIRVAVENAEYWDSPASGFVYLYDYAKAALTGERPDNVGDHKKVAM